MIWVILVILLLLVALFVLLRYERHAHRDPRPGGTMVNKKGETVPIKHGALDEPLFTAIKLGLADDWRRLRHRGRPR